MNSHYSKKGNKLNPPPLKYLKKRSSNNSFKNLSLSQDNKDTSFIS